MSPILCFNICLKVIQALTQYSSISSFCLQMEDANAKFLLVLGGKYLFCSLKRMV